MASKKITKSKKPVKRKKTVRKKRSAYGVEEIYVLKGVEPVRKRPGMYIGSTGPQGLHHLLVEVVGNSVTYQTPIIFENQGKIQIERIGTLVNQFFQKNPEKIEKSQIGDSEILREGFDLKTLSFDPQTYKLRYQPIFSLIRHKTRKPVYRVTLQNGRSVEITSDHSLFTLREGQVVSIRGSDLKIGERVVVPKVWPELQNPVKDIDLIEEFLKLPKEKTNGIYLYNIKGLLKNNKALSQHLKSVLPQYLKSRHSPNIQRDYLKHDYLRFDYLPVNLLRGLKGSEIECFKRKDCLIGNRSKSGYRIKNRLKINKDLVELLGLFAAEGSLETNKWGASRITFSFGSEEKELIDYTIQLIRKVFGYNTKAQHVHDTAKNIRISSRFISLIFKEILQTGVGSSNKKVPDIVFNLPQRLREGYLMAYLAGDGYPAKIFTTHLIKKTSPSKNERRKFTAVSVNKSLLSGISYLLSSLNKTYCFGTRKKKHKKRFIGISYNGRKKRIMIKPQEFCYAIDFYWNTNSSYINYLPAQEVISKVLWDYPCPWSVNTQGGVSNSKVSGLLERDKLILYPSALKFLTSDLGLLKVRKIEKIQYKYPWVYDISVPQGENFVGGFSPICCHNSVDEAMMGYCNEIQVALLPQNRVKVEDNGRGIPIAKHPQTKKSGLETVMTTLHAGAKFGGKVYASTGGLHGVGISAVCALSKYLKAEVCRDGKKVYQEFSRGKAKTKLKNLGKCKKAGTSIIFEPDPEIFKEIKFNAKKILNHLRQQAYLMRGVKIVFSDQRKEVEKEKEEYTFYFEGGLVSYIKHLVKGDTPRHKNLFYGSGEKNGAIVEAAFQYTKEYECFEESFVNNICTSDGGSHLTGFRSALTRTLNDWARKNGFLKEKDLNLSGEDIREGLTAVVLVKIKEPQFEGQTKRKLGNPEVKPAVEAVVSESLIDFLEKNPPDARAIIENCIISAKARKAAKAARQTVLRKGALEGLSLPGKLADCTSRDPSESELYLVEGESAGGSGRQARDRHFQAILPLRGKILNVERARLDRILGSKEIKALIIALGTAVAEDFDIDKIRYQRIIIMADSDSDGRHIVTLLLTLFYRYFRPIIEKGYLYIAQAPLYKIQVGKQTEYGYAEQDKTEILSSLAKKAAPSIQRYKGLGEMNPEELWSTTMNPENRVLLQITIEDAKEADRIFDTLMGEEVLPRKKFIQTHAKKVKNLDI